MGEYTTFQIAKKVGVTYWTLREWLNGGFINPSIARSLGQGTKSIFSEDDLTTIKYFKQIIDMGFSRKVASKMVRPENIKEMDMGHSVMFKINEKAVLRIWNK